MLVLLVLAALPLIGIYLYNKAYHKRFVQFASIPQLPSSLVWGHLQIFDAYIKRGPRDRHPDLVFAEMLETLGKPPLMFVDLRPVNRPMVLVTSHEIAEQISKPSALFPTSVPKANLDYLNHVIGTTSILSAEGDHWKHLRKRFNPGFAPQHLLTHLPAILDKTLLFVDHLDKLARTNAEAPMLPLLVNLTFDIIGVVAMGVDLEAQRTEGQGELIKLFSQLLSCYLDDKADYPWWVIPNVELRRYRLGKRIDNIIRDIVRQKYQEYQRTTDDKSRSVLSLSFQDTNSLSPEVLHTTSDQLKSFLLAGHDTTSTTLSWVFYELMRTPRALKAVRDEVRKALGPDPDVNVIRSRLLIGLGADLLNKMPYMNAVIKETLRMHPPAATARTSPFGSSLTVRTPDGRSHCLDGTIIYNCESMIHRDPAIYGDTADHFRPERWLGDSHSASSKVPASAWRPFERGPRNCIGQEFANIEIRVIISLVVLRYDFIKVGMGELDKDDNGQPILDDAEQFRVKSHIYPTRQITIKPVDGMRMRVKFAASKV
ncbi:cytochrome P450 [Apiospora kogelbergensis]|uniref:Cytochrome P450 n=1 Tax=Apiospora kogelbergensis TaxID=1337665 RepID=A0AAW0R520_9PEZI